ncbi:uncharacterized protein N7484_000290 [Penicillium longicatenatum]|uniref:uncharacterized protein n=1 Tax=Penicillium longicatenatum TaxID=1561947 RepID=UPI0025487DEE|nr:uncharacterized protein N7484_000290 [Penicillium longicatenatum]KAJ5660918.1 hypothetical protein N7484_000290 [Penicillium longicatenatum]
MTTIQHPILGRIQGNKKNDLVEFLGIQYASLAHQFAPPVPINRKDFDELIDATSYGPSVGGVDGCDSEFDLIQHKLPRTHFAKSATQGLNLNITVPNVNDSPTKLPFLVFLHGGGFGVGSSSCPQHQLTNLVSITSELGLPVVGVNINYRVGPAGFLTSKELRDAGFTPNNGLRDQRVALQWIKTHIDGFGGDSENITLVGHSAGGVSASLHLASEEPLFKRVACLSGQFLAVKPLPDPAHEHFYAESLRILGLDDLSPSERVSRIQGLNADEVAKISAFPSRPIVDGDICLEMPSVKAITDGIQTTLHRGWCQDFFIGDCQFDGSIMAGALDHRKSGIGKAFEEYLTKEVEDIPGLSSKILSTYGIDSDNNDDEALHGILRLLNDVFFYIPTVYLAQSWNDGAAYVYRFNSLNPWEGRWKGKASHITDLTMLLHNYDEFLNEEQKIAGQDYTRDLLAFVSGKKPWQASYGQGAFEREYGHLQGGRSKSIWDIIKEIEPLRSLFGISLRRLSLTGLLWCWSNSLREDRHATFSQFLHYTPPAC